ncbi:Uncharacterised protein [Corynebacterium diphtheriae]|nr:Uncharacterised protein [Corynebacterium diphtheriae]
MDKEKQTQSDAIRRKVLGDNYVNTTLKGWAPHNPCSNYLRQLPGVSLA